MVTLEGELLEKSGAMTGGATKKQGGRGFGAAVDDEIYRIVPILQKSRVKRQRLNQE